MRLFVYQGIYELRGSPYHINLCDVSENSVQKSANYVSRSFIAPGALILGFHFPVANAQLLLYVFNRGIIFCAQVNMVIDADRSSIVGLLESKSCLRDFLASPSIILIFMIPLAVVVACGD